MASNTRTTTLSDSDLLTTADIARAIGTDLGRVQYIIGHRLLAKPLRRFGTTNVYSPEIIPKVRAELKRIAARTRPVKVG